MRAARAAGRNDALRIEEPPLTQSQGQYRASAHSQYSCLRAERLFVGQNRLDLMEIDKVCRKVCLQRLMLAALPTQGQIQIAQPTLARPAVRSCSRFSSRE